MDDIGEGDQVVHRQQGVLFLVVGPSGVGKDSLIGGARKRLARKTGCHFPTRLITRPEGAGGENHQAVSEAAFERMEAAGDLMLSWAAHDHRYGIPKAAEQALTDGCAVVVNVSRQVIGEARRRFPPVRVLLVTAPGDVVRSRLRARGREADADIERRLQRADAYQVTGDDVREIVNAGDLDHAIDRFVAVIEEEIECAISGR